MDYWGMSEYNPVREIKEAKRLLVMKKSELKDLQYVVDVMKANWVSKIKSNPNIFNEQWLHDAQHQRTEKYKKDRPQFESLKSIVGDRLGIEKLNITSISSYGYDNMGYFIYFTHDKQDYILFIPILKNLNVNNIENAYSGMFNLSKRESEVSWKSIFSDYDFDELGKAFQEYIKLGEGVVEW